MFEKNKLKIFLLISIMLSLLFAGGMMSVLASNLGDAFGDILQEVAGEKGAGYKADAEPESIIGSIIQVALSFLGVIFLILMIYGGFLWMTAKGNEEQVTKAKNLITAAIIGLIIVISAYAISYVLIKQVGGGTLLDKVS